MLAPGVTLQSVLSGILTSVLLAQFAAGTAHPPQVDVLAAAAASPRPSECSRLTRSDPTSRDNVWERARLPRLRKYCDALARGYSRLSRTPSEALAAARVAEGILSGRAATLVLEARALYALGRPEQAWPAFAKARVLSKRSIEAPAALHDLARAALLAGHAAEALAAYRALVPRAGLFDDPVIMQRVYVEAAVLAMAAGPEALNEAVGYLTEARHVGIAPGLRDFVLGALALAFDRQGRPDEANGVSVEAEGPWRLERLASSSRLLVLPPGELHAMIGILAQGRDSAIAHQAWTECLRAAPAGRWADYAKSKLAKVGAPRRKAGP